MRTVITLRNEQDTYLPREFTGHDVRMPSALPACFLKQYTRVGDCVLDPFAGYGTTVRIAEAMGCEGWGIEPQERRVLYARTLLAHPERLLQGSVFDLSGYDLPRFDFVFCSPPYMGKEEMINPLTGGNCGYADYLLSVVQAFRSVQAVLKPQARIVVEVSNLMAHEGNTFLAFDYAREISSVLRLEQEIIVAWEPTYGYGYDHSYCLVFMNDLLELPPASSALT